MSAQSSAEHYRIINEVTAKRLGGRHNARSLMLTVDFHEIEALISRGEWDRVARQMRTAAHQMEAGGADFLVLCTNTVHRVAEQIQTAVSIPLLHVADAAAEAVRADGFRTVALLGTRFVMEQEFYRNRLEALQGLSVLIPEVQDRAIIHRVIFDELCHGKVRETSRRQFERVIAGLRERRAEAVMLGCTELMLLIGSSTPVAPVFDTTTIHVQRVVDFALG